MSKNNHTDESFRNQADDRFSVTPLQDRIDARFEEPVEDTYTVKELHQLHRFAARALQRKTSKNDVYGAEVFVVMEGDDFVYHVESDGTHQRVTYDDGV